MDLTTILKKTKDFDMKSKQLHHIEPHSNLFIFKHVKIQNAMDNFNFFGHHALPPLGNFSHVVASMSSLKNTRKM